MKNVVILVNLGTPTAPTYWPLRKYLKQFLSDKRVVNKNRIFWLTLLNVVLLQIIPQKSAKNYAKIWNKVTGESPLLTFTKQQVVKLQEKLGNNTIVDFAFTYDAGVIENSIAYKLEKYKDCNITVLSLYPQYSTATTASIEDQIGNADVKFISSYYNSELYIKALENSLKKVKAKDVLVSFHGLPVEYIKNGDPYQKQCEKTFELLQAKYPDKVLHLAYQSKFGNDEWLTPATDATVVKLAKNEVKDLAIITPGFAVDCIETLEEIAIGIKEEFLLAGGESFEYISCLNATENAIELYSDIIKGE